MKCNVCGKEKPREEFPKKLCGRCKECKYEYTRQWKAKNRDKVNKADMEWRKAHYETYLESQRKTYHKHIEKRREYGRNLWHKYSKKWNAEIREKRKLLKEKYGFCHNTFERNGGIETVIAVYERAGYKCEECGGEYKLQIHHKDNKGRKNINKRLKPNNNLNNLKVLCVNCHLKLHKKY